VSKSHSCCQAKVQLPKRADGKCDNQKRCCFKTPSPTATINNHQFVLSTNQVHPVCLTGVIFAQSNFISEPVSFSTGPPLQFSGRMQSVLCVFTI
jgi:hypothetical protein